MPCFPKNGLESIHQASHCTRNSHYKVRKGTFRKVNTRKRTLPSHTSNMFNHRLKKFDKIELGKDNSIDFLITIDIDLLFH